ncbi:MAG TPA: TonB-dependent receptor [Cellvibrio sp.]|nr:TonB-dependent receptor [Cellvibrio sp.]
MNKKITAGSFLLFSPWVFADGLSIDEITVYGRGVPLIGQAISASEGRISQQDIAIRPLLRTGEILESVPGLVATQHSGSGKANQYFLRGFNLDHGTDFATFVDAMPVNMRSHGHGQGYTDLNFIIPELVSGIHYKKGPYSADVGDFSGAGSADIATTNTVGNKIALGLGEDDFYRTLATGQAALAQGNFIYGVEYQTYQGPWDAIAEDLSKKNLWLKQVWSRGKDEYALTLMAYDNSWNSADQIPQRAVEQGLISYLGSIDPSVGGESSRYSLSGNLRREINEDTRLHAHVYGIRYKMNLWSNFSYFTEPEGDQFQQTDNRNLYGGDAAVTRVTHFAHSDMLNTLGMQLRYDDIDKVGLLHTAKRTLLNPIRTDAVAELSNSLYWKNTLALTPALRSSLGARYDYFSFSVTPLTAEDLESLAHNGGRRSAAITTGSAALIYTLNKQQEIYTSVGQGFHSNDARGVTIKSDPRNSEPIASVDPLIKTLGYELGWRGNFAETLNTSIALWHLAIDSELIYVGDEGITEDTGIGSSREGVEVTAYYHLAPTWTLDMEYAYTHARFDTELDGSRSIPGALRQVLTTGINWQATDQFFADLKWRHFAGYPLDSGESAEGSDLLNLRMGYKVDSRLKLTLDILNLLNSKDHDVEYFYPSQLAGESEPVADHHYHAFEPRTARLYLEWKFF